MLVLKDPETSQYTSLYRLISNVLLAVPGEERQVQNQCNPVSVDKEEKGQESVYGGFGDDVRVETVA